MIWRSIWNRSTSWIFATDIIWDEIWDISWDCNQQNGIDWSTDQGHQGHLPAQYWMSGAWNKHQQEEFFPQGRGSVAQRAQTLSYFTLLVRLVSRFRKLGMLCLFSVTLPLRPVKYVFVWSSACGPLHCDSCCLWPTQLLILFLFFFQI